LFCKINLYLSLPLVCLLAATLIHFAATQSSLTREPFQLIVVLWLSGYLFALATTCQLRRIFGDCKPTSRLRCCLTVIRPRPL
jgi:hypothetical protein